MKLIIGAFLFFNVIVANGEPPPGDYEETKVACFCGCSSNQVVPIRIRLPGGGYGFEYRYAQLLNRDALGYRAEYPIPHIKNSTACRQQSRRRPCTGYADLDAGRREELTAGMSYGCSLKPYHAESYR